MDFPLDVGPEERYGKRPQCKKTLNIKVYVSARRCISERSVQSLSGRFIPSSHHDPLLWGIPPSHRPVIRLVFPRDSLHDLLQSSSCSVVSDDMQMSRDYMTRFSHGTYHIIHENPCLSPRISVVLGTGHSFIRRPPD
eukprot:scaffold95401_cov60-Cyclotella_meneghiniana.AAC.1